MKIEIIQYNKELYTEIINLKLKKEDINEVEKLSGLSVKEHLIESIDLYSDYILLIKYNGNVEGIFGVVPYTEVENTGVGFFLTTDKISEFSWEVARYTKEAMDFFLNTYDVIFNFVPKSYKISIKWLKRNGAIFEEKQHTINGETFLRFYITK